MVVGGGNDIVGAGATVCVTLTLPAYYMNADAALGTGQVSGEGANDGTR